MLGKQVALTIFIIAAPIFWICVGVTTNSKGPVSDPVAVVGSLAFAGCVAAAMLFAISAVWGF